MEDSEILLMADVLGSAEYASGRLVKIERDEFS